ncbi:choice-of-anchor G family protein [Nakamurella panacisegetis]|uniref:choice-of-anchor G family protein n=1 Tax=Nakamurella panacisegetis TaxID=1090615 RepID=UPI001560DC96|nr:choice-of-anchor G family protein [Nakamurella panacisegetis]
MTATGLTVAMVAGSLLLTGTAASAASAPAVAEGQFLSGILLGNDLANLVSVTPAKATANAAPPAVTVSNPLSVTALNAVNLDLGSGINLLGTQGILTLGAVGQYATASSTGSSSAASGAVDNSGAVGVGAGFPAADASLSLDSLIAAVPALGTALSTGTLQVGAVSATAAETAAGVQSGTYKIASLQLQVKSPLVAGITSTLTTQLTALQPTVDGVTATLNGLGLGLVTVTGIPNLANLVSTLGTVSVDGGGIVADLNTGSVTVDLAKLLTFQGKDLNSLPRNTDLLAVITTALTADLLPAIQTALSGLVNTLTTAINGITATVLGIPISASVLKGVLDPIIAQVVAPVNTLSAGLGTSVITPLADALSGLLAITANEQPVAPNSGATFTQTALRVGLVPTGHTAQIDLASASVGPNAGPSDPPTAATLSPSSGPSAGGTTVTVTGTGFVPGATTVNVDGVNQPATATSTTSLTFVTPAHAAGPVDVTVQTAGGTSAPQTYNFYDVPTGASLSPNRGPAAGGTVVTITGTGFVPGATTVEIGGITIPAGQVTVTDGGTKATFTTPAHAPGTVDVVATTAGGTSTPALPFTFDALAATGISPDHGPTTGNTTVTVTGTGFVPGKTSITIGGTVVPASQVTVDPTGTTAVFATPAHAAGGVLVTATTPSGTTKPLGYLYGASTLPVTSCVLTGVNPKTGLNAATVSVLANIGIDTSLVPSTFTITGTGINPASSTSVVPLLGGFLDASISVPVAAGTTSVSYQVAPVASGAYTTVTGGPIPCTTITPVEQAAGAYHPLAPYRVLDTRSGTGAVKHTLAPGATMKVQVRNIGGVPALGQPVGKGVATVMLNVTTTNSASVGYLTVFPGPSRPIASSVNFAAKSTVANLVAAAVASDGTVSIYNGSVGATDVVADIQGYFSDGPTVAPGSFVSLSPSRLLDTANGTGAPQGTVKPYGTIKLKVTGVGGVPTTNVAAVTLNMTVDGPTRPGYITAYRSNPRPFVSSLNFYKGQTDANLVIAPVAADGTVSLYNGSPGTVRLVADVAGYFRGGIAVLDGEFVPVEPNRLLDTRVGNNVNGKVGAKSSISPTVLGRTGIPATGVSAVVANLTVTNAEGPGFITAFPQGTVPLASNLNFVARQDRPNAMFPRIGGDGKVRLYNGAASTSVDLVTDVSGYFINNPVN